MKSTDLQANSEEFMQKRPTPTGSEAYTRRNFAPVLYS